MCGTSLIRRAPPVEPRLVMCSRYTLCCAFEPLKIRDWYQLLQCPLKFITIMIPGKHMTRWSLKANNMEGRRNCLCLVNWSFTTAHYISIILLHKPRNIIIICGNLCMHYCRLMVRVSPFVRSRKRVWEIRTSLGHDHIRVQLIFSCSTLKIACNFKFQILLSQKLYTWCSN